MSYLSRIVAALLASVFLSQAAAEQLLNHTLTDRPPRALPRKLVVLPAEVSVMEISAGGVRETVPSWTEQASTNLSRAIAEIASQRTDFSLSPAPELSEDEKNRLDEYLATYLVVGLSAFRVTQLRDAAWEHKRTRFDYTLGSGLAFLKEKTGADGAIVIVGEDLVSSAERKATAIVAALVGVAVPLGQSVILVGVVDLATGDLLWLHHTSSQHYDLKDYDAAKSMLAEIFGAYPGLEKAP